MLVQRTALFAAALGLVLSSLTAAAQNSPLPGQPPAPPAPPPVPQPPPVPPLPPVPYWWLTQPGADSYGQKGYGQNPYGRSSYERMPYSSGMYGMYGGMYQKQPYPGSYRTPDTANGQQPHSHPPKSHDAASHHKETAAPSIRPHPVYPSVSDTASPYHYYAPGQDYYSPTSTLRSGSYSAKPYGGMSGSYGAMPYGGMYGAYGSNASANKSTDSSSSAPTYAPSSAPVVDVGLYDNSYLPGITYISAGTVVRWTNRGKHHHTVTSDEGLWDSGTLRPGEGHAIFFPLPGTYYYHCKEHPRSMRGWVVVRGTYY